MAVIPYFIVDAALRCMRKIHGPCAVGTTFGITAAGEDLAGEMTVYGTTGMTVAHFYKEKIVNAISAVLSG